MVSDENENKDELNISTKSSCSSGSESFSSLKDFGHSNQNHQNFDGDLAMIQDKMKIFRRDLIREINERSEIFKNEIENLLTKNTRDLKNIERPASVGKVVREGPREKVFEHRESLLTELFKISHIRTVRHIFISILIIICFQIIIFDLATLGRINLDFDLLRWLFEGFLPTMFYAWLPMQLSSLLLVYYCFVFWASKHHELNSSLYITFLGLLVLFPLVLVNKVSIACRIVILMEQVRLLMKSHAFVRSNTGKILRFDTDSAKNDSDQPKLCVIPEFSKYLYFMFAPTLVYRDQYPRTTIEKIRWKLVFTHFGEVLGAIIYTYCLFDRFCVPVFRDLKVKELNFQSYLHLISICIMPGALMQFMSKAWAEMLRFGDRQFYLDWWNSTSFNFYYRTWNTLVQDWLYTYIYKDLYKIFGKKYRALCQFSVIFISGIFHEHILSFTFGFFYPVLFILFAGFGFVCLFIPRGNSAPWNVFIWVSLFSGLGIQISLFSIEWYARQTSQCPRKIDSIFDYFVPRSILC